MLVEILLEAGAEPDIQSEEKDTPLHIASRLGHLELVNKLAAIKAINTQNEVCHHVRREASCDLTHAPHHNESPAVSASSCNVSGCAPI